MRRPPPAWAGTLLLAVAWLVLGPATPDLAAQVHRVGMFATHGFSVWDNTWYDGHHALGYSLVFPAVGAAVGARIAGAAAAVASAALFESLLRGRGARAACWWFGIGCVADLVIGRLTYALGVTVGLAAIAAFTRGWAALAVALAVACAATSPVAGLFLALAGVGLALARRDEGAGAQRRRGRDRGALSPRSPRAAPSRSRWRRSRRRSASRSGSRSPCGATAGCASRRCSTSRPSWRRSRSRARWARTSPASGRRSRGRSCSSPRVGGRGRAGRSSSPSCSRAAAMWQWVDPAVQVARAWRDPSASAVYYRPLLAELRRADPSGARIEVPFTRDHWESVFLARRYPLARGWERQLDRRLNPLFYRPRLDAAAYGRWLRSRRSGMSHCRTCRWTSRASARRRSWCRAPRSSSRSGAGPLAPVPIPRPAAAGDGRGEPRPCRRHGRPPRRPPPGADRAARALDAVLAAERGRRLRPARRGVDAADRPAGGVVRARGALLARRPARAVRRLQLCARGRVQPGWRAPQPLQ